MLLVAAVGHRPVDPEVPREEVPAIAEPGAQRHLVLQGGTGEIGRAGAA